MLARKWELVRFEIRKFLRHHRPTPIDARIYKRLAQPRARLHVSNTIRHVGDVKRRRLLPFLWSQYRAAIGIIHRRADLLHLLITQVIQHSRHGELCSVWRNFEREKLTVLTVIEHRTLDLVNPPPIFFLRIWFVEDVKFLLPQTGTAEAVFTIVTVVAVFKILRPPAVHRILDIVAMPYLRAHPNIRSRISCCYIHTILGILRSIVVTAVRTFQHVVRICRAYTIKEILSTAVRRIDVECLWKRRGLNEFDKSPIVFFKC